MHIRHFERFTLRGTSGTDEDIFNIARQKTQREGVPTGTAMSELMRLGMCSMQTPPAQRLPTRSKQAMLPARNETITNDHVYSIMEQEGM